MPSIKSSRTGFSMPEVLVVVGVIGLIIAFLFPALASVLRTGKMTSSLNNLRQINTMMQVYSQDNRQTIVPSRFDYSGAQFTYKGKVRSDPPTLGDQHVGTWTDILWTTNDLGSDIPNAAYRYDSPDNAFYQAERDFDANPFRSTAANTMEVDMPAIPGALPFGDGAVELGEPGYLAANDFFDATPTGPGDIGTWYSAGQIKAPNRSMYLVDSFAGEVIDPLDLAAWDLANETIQVDFRHNDLCLMLFLDGHTKQEAFWTDRNDLEARGIRIRGLTTSGP